MSENIEERVCAAYEPALYSDDPVVAHRCASPFTVEAARQQLRERLAPVIAIVRADAAAMKEALCAALEGEYADEPAEWAVEAERNAVAGYAAYMGDPNDDGYDNLSEAERAAAFAIQRAAIAAIRALPDPASSPAMETDDEGPCTDCDDTGVTIQTERRCSCQPAPSPAVAGEREQALLTAVKAGQFDAIEAVAEKWHESAGVQRMANAIASVFEKHASQEIMDRFRKKVADLMRLAFVEGAAQGVMQFDAILATRPSSDALQAKNDQLREALAWIDLHGDDQDTNHVNFRIGAASRARAALADREAGK